MEEIITPPEIKTLVDFLLNNGGPVISGHTKFSVTPKILKQINIILDKVKGDIYVSSLTNADLINKYAKKNELMFLYDFVKKTPKLKISNTASSHDFNVDIADFSNLNYLELYKFNVKHVKNLKFLRDHLDTVVCIRSLDNVGDLLLSPDSDCDIWSKLKNAKLSRNDILSLDQSFIYTPWLQYLDISYNHLTDLRPLTCLRRLTYLNASYNRLTEIPAFDLPELKTLLLGSNHISDISGISKLKNLQECDLSGNCLAEHVNLLPLADLPSLISLNVSRNPLSFDSRHRFFTCGYLHENVLDQYFLLDEHPLVASEKQFIRRCSREVVNKFTRRLRTPSTSSYSNDDISSIDIDQPIVRPKNSRKTVRTAIIKDNVSVDDVDDRSYACSTPIAHQESEDGEHLEMKKEIEFLRSKYGEDGWLHGTSASAVQNLMNIGTPPSESTPFAEGVPITHIFNPDSNASITNIIYNNSVKEKESLMEQVPAVLENEKTAETVETEPNYSVYETASSSSSEESDPEENYGPEDLWLVERISDDGEEHIFLSLTESDLKERSKKNNKIIVKWGIHQIQWYEKISSEPYVLSLRFDVARRGDKTRKYKMEYADAQKLIGRVQQELDKKTLKDINQKVLHCMKCGTIFCAEIRVRKSGFIEHDLEYKCSTCGSVAVIEEDESLIHPKSNLPETPAPATKQQSANNEKVTQSPSLSSIGSAASLDQNNDQGSANDLHGNNHESDIEIMSNPSQSSIEVLEIHGSDNMKTVLKIVDKPAPAETSTPANSSSNYILTESSSSGSMTDSICTSYETTNQSHSRGPHRISQSTVDEVLQEEPISGSSPRRSIKNFMSTERGDTILGTSPKRSVKNFAIMERRDSVTGTSPKKNTKNIAMLERRDSKLKLDFSGVLGDMLQSVSSRILSSSPRSTGNTLDLDGPLSVYEYSYSDFSYIDPRIKLHLWDKFIPTSEDIRVFLRADSIIKDNAVEAAFAGFFVFTTEKIYIMKITKAERGDPNTWLEKQATVRLARVKLIEAAYYNQGVLFKCADQYNQSKYLLLLHDRQRTANFLSFMKQTEILPLGQVNDIYDEGMPPFPRLDETIRNFIISDSIVIYKDNEEWKKYSLVGFAFTESLLLVLRSDIDWLSNETSETTESNLTIEQEMQLVDLVCAEDKRTILVLQFVDERKQIEYYWHIKTGLGINDSIIDQLSALWSPHYRLKLPIKRSTS